MTEREQHLAEENLKASLKIEELEEWRRKELDQNAHYQDRIQTLEREIQERANKALVDAAHKEQLVYWLLSVPVLALSDGAALCLTGLGYAPNSDRAKRMVELGEPAPRKLSETEEREDETAWFYPETGERCLDDPERYTATIKAAGDGRDLEARMDPVSGAIIVRRRVS